MAGEPAPLPPWKQGEHAALALRHELALGNGPIDIFEVIERREVPLAWQDFGADGGDGLYVLKDGQPLIVLNSAPSPARKRFTAAHELGHHELHGQSGQDTFIRDQDVYATKGRDGEVAANAFAAALLAPRAGIEDELGGARAAGGEIDARGVAALMGVFGLSYRATVYRLHNCGFIDSLQRDQLLAEGKTRVAQLRSAAGLPSDETPVRSVHVPAEYTEHVIALWQHHLISDVRFAEMLRMEPGAATRYRDEHALTRSAHAPPDGEAVQRLLDELG